MNRYPDTIVILKTDNDDPYAEEVKYTEVYRGRCRCFFLKSSNYRTGKVAECTHEVVIPDCKMPEIGENFKVGVHMHNSPGDEQWTYVGYVRDFARYDRVCNLYFEIVKENLVEEDVPTDETEESGEESST